MCSDHLYPPGPVALYPFCPMHFCVLLCCALTRALSWSYGNTILLYGALLYTPLLCSDQLHLPGPTTAHIFYLVYLCVLLVK
jgi:hypothetical protein